MKIAVATLNRYFKKARSTEEIARLIERTEIELEQIFYSKKLDRNIILAKIVDIFPHPNADRLRKVIVTTGKAKHELVCGAPNLTVGQKVAYVQPGTTLPDGSVIESATIRGESSEGMLASSRELGLSDDHDGIWVYEGSDSPLGTSLCDIVLLGDVLDIKTPANRWDYLSGEGIARELAVYDDTPHNFIPVEIGQYDYSKIELVNVKSRAENPRFTSARLRVKNDVKSPAWLVDNLALNGIATHTPVVDITNFVMLELGQPTHAYDASALSGPLSVRFSEEGESITTLDNVKRTLTSRDLVVADSVGPVSLAGIIGSARCQVESTTTEIVIEAAIWDKTIIRRTALKQGLRTEASTRFERGLPLPLAPHALSRMIDLLRDICDARILEGPFDQLHAWPWQQALGLRLRYAERILGLSLEEKTVLQGLRSMGFAVRHFSPVKEFESHLGKPYKWGANSRQDQESAFDCSYLVDRVYSRIGVFVGHTSLGQFHHGRSIEVDQLKPGDNLFIRGKIEHSAVDHYYTTTPHGVKEKVTLETPMEVGHNGIYIGGGKVIHASQYMHQGDDWVERPEQGVIVSPVEEFTKDPGYLGARRYVENFNHLYAVDVPWWRPDIRMESDLIEEIGKLVGYDHIPSTLPDIPAMNQSDGTLAASMQLRRMFAASGMTEVMTYSFISATGAEASGIDSKYFLPISNPRSPEQAFVRASLLPSHIQLWSLQPSAVRSSVVCFEISTVFESKGLATQPREHWQLGLSARGERGVEIIQASLQHIMKLGGVRYSLVPDARHGALIKQRSARIMIGDTQIGVVGQVASTTLQKLGLKAPLAWAEIELSDWLAARQPAVLSPLPPYQLVVRDVSLTVAESVWWETISTQAQQQKNVWAVEYLDTYRSPEQTKQAKKVVTFRLLLDCGSQPTGDVIDAVLGRIEAALNKLST